MLGPSFTEYMMETKEAIKVQLPEVDHTNTVELGAEHILFINLYHSEAENPLTDIGGMGTIYSFSTKHVSYRHPDKLPEEYKEHRVFLSYFEHGLCRWAPRGDLDGVPDARWDMARTAGVWYPDKYTVDAIPADTEDAAGWMRKRAEHACDIYTEWCNGSVYGYRVAVYEAVIKPDGKPAKRWDTYQELGRELVDDACGGFFGYSHGESGLLEQVNDAVRSALGDKYVIEVVD